MTTIEQLDQFHKTKTGYIVFGLIELVLLYVLISISIDTANMFVYFASFILALGLLRNVYLLGRLIYRDSQK